MTFEDRTEKAAEILAKMICEKTEGWATDKEWARQCTYLAFIKGAYWGRAEKVLDKLVFNAQKLEIAKQALEVIWCARSRPFDEDLVTTTAREALEKLSEN